MDPTSNGNSIKACKGPDMHRAVALTICPVIEAWFYLRVTDMVNDSGVVTITLVNIICGSGGGFWFGLVWGYTGCYAILKCLSKDEPSGLRTV